MSEIRRMLATYGHWKIRLDSLVLTSIEGELPGQTEEVDE